MPLINLPTRATEIFDLFAQDPEMQRLLGKYRLDDGSVVPALICLWPNETLPPQSRTTGVELVVVRSISGGIEHGLGFTPRISNTFRMYAVQWEPEVPGDYCMEEVLLRIAQLLPNCSWEETDIDSRADGLGQVAIKWRNPALGACLPEP